MNKVLFIGPDTSSTNRYMGGIHYIIQPLKDRKQKFQGHDLDISFFNTERISRKHDSANQIKIENIKNAYKIFKDCSNEIEKEHYDTILYASSVNFALLKDLLIAERLKQKHKIKIIFQIHSADINKILPKNFFLGKIIFNKLVKTCDKCIFLSSRLMQKFVEMGYPKEKTHVLYNYHNMELDGELVKTRKLQNHDSKKTRLMFIGSFNREKGLLDLLEALQTIDDCLYSFDLCGGYNSDDRELKILLEKYCSRYKQAAANQGYVSGDMKKEVFINADVCILPSYWEGLPVVLLEAMAAGCAVITTDVGAIGEVIKDGINGIIISPGDVAALRAALLSLINNNNLLRTMQNANYWEADKYTIEKYIDKLSVILHSV